MMTIPYPVARMILLGQIHPVAAWRQYYGLSKEKLAEYLQVRLDEIIKMENSNQHLQPDNLKKLCNIFGVYTQALNIRYDSYN